MALFARQKRLRQTHMFLLVLMFILLAIMPGQAQPGDAGPGLNGIDLAGLLGGPLPGTQARADADLAARLEGLLSGFDGIEGASVLVTNPQQPSDRSPHVAVQLRLADGFAPTAAWLETIHVLSTRAIPELEPDGLTVVDTTGRTLSHAGRAILPEAAPPDPQPRVVDETWHIQPWWLWAAAGAGFLLVVAGVAAPRLLRREPDPEPVEEVAGPFDFLADLPETQLAQVLAEERPAVLAAVLAVAPDAIASRLREHDGISGEPPGLRDQPDPAMIDALAEALRGRLIGT